MAVTVDEALEHQRSLERGREAEGQARAALLAGKLPEAVELLRAHHGVERVVLFGSLATGEVNSNSDVDLAVEGLAPARYFAALADLMALFRGPVDLVRIEDAPPSLRHRIESEGRAP